MFLSFLWSFNKSCFIFGVGTNIRIFLRSLKSFERMFGDIKNTCKSFLKIDGPVKRSGLTASWDASVAGSFPRRHKRVMRGLGLVVFSLNLGVIVHGNTLKSFS